MSNLEDKVASLSTEVSSVKADQSRLLVAINNIQRAVSPTTPLLPEILRLSMLSRSTWTTPPTIEELHIRIVDLFAQKEHHAEAVIDDFSSPPRCRLDLCRTPQNCRGPSSSNRSRDSPSSTAPHRRSFGCCISRISSTRHRDLRIVRRRHCHCRLCHGGEAMGGDAARVFWLQFPPRPYSYGPPSTSIMGSFHQARIGSVTAQGVG
jgi:hypothetical protein